MHDLAWEIMDGWIFLVVCQVCSLRQKCLAKIIPFLRLIQCDGWIFSFAYSQNLLVLRCWLTCRTSFKSQMGEQKEKQKPNLILFFSSSLLSSVLFGWGLWIYIHQWLHSIKNQTGWHSTFGWCTTIIAHIKNFIAVVNDTQFHQ